MSLEYVTVISEGVIGINLHIYLHAFIKLTGKGTERFGKNESPVKIVIVSPARIDID